MKSRFRDSSFKKDSGVQKCSGLRQPTRHCVRRKILPIECESRLVERVLVRKKEGFIGIGKVLM